MTTQKQVNKAIDYFLTEADKFEVKRDACRFESEAYWMNHDYYMNLVLTAESLMPQ